MDPERLADAGRTIRSCRGKRRARDVASSAGMSERRYLDIERGYITTRDGYRKPVQASANEYNRIALALDMDPTQLAETLGIEQTGNTQMTTQQHTSLGDFLYRRRMTALNGLSLRDVAAGSGLAHTTLYHYEAGRSLPSKKNVATVAKAYGMKPRDLRALIDAELANRVELALPEKFQALTPESYRALLAHADLLLSLQERADGSHDE